MSNEKTLDNLYDDLEEGAEDNQLNPLMDNDLIDPDTLEQEDDDDGFFNEEDDLLNLSDENADEQNKEVTEDLDNDIVIAENPVINEILAAKGILDPKAIKYEDEAGEIQEVDFYSLPYEDQLEILKSDANAAPEFSEHELDVVEFLRAQNATLDDVISYAQRQAVEEYIRDNNGESFVVDDYDDSELYIMDLKIKYEDLTDEDLQLELEKELQHQDLFKKKVDKIRQEYINLEIENKEIKLNADLQKEDADFKQLTDSLVEVAVGVTDIGGLTLQVDDKNQVLSTILEKDINGVSKFIKSLDNPQTLFEVAWYAEKGNEAFEMIHDYYKKQFDTISKNAYAKGKADATKTTSTGKPEKLSFVRTANKADNKLNGLKSIDDLV